ncbi:immunity 53 family protein [Actinoallomurus oryzae]
MAHDLQFDPDRPDVWIWLQAWYVAQCDGDWEHGHGITITTLDNPGWHVTIDLTDTGVAPEAYTRREVRRSEDDWCITWTENATFQAACGPANLAEAIHEFRLWTTSQAQGSFIVDGS